MKQQDKNNNFFLQQGKMTEREKILKIINTEITLSKILKMSCNFEDTITKKEMHKFHIDNLEELKKEIKWVN